MSAAAAVDVSSPPPAGKGSGGGRTAQPEVRSELVRLAIPLLAQSLLTTLVFFVDRMVLGRFSSDALASMHVSGPLVWSTYSVLSSFAVGTLAVVGRAYGAGDHAEVSAAARSSLALALGLGCVAAAILYPVLPFVVAHIPEAGAGVRASVLAYMGAVLPSLPCILVLITASAVLQACGDARTPFLAAALGNVVNLALNLVLVFGLLGFPRLGALGAGIATSIAMALEAAFLVIALLVPGGRVTLRGGLSGTRSALQRVVRVARTVVLERIAQHTGFLSFVALIASFGDLAMAANQTLIAIESICFHSADAIGIAAASMVARRLGANAPDEAESAARWGVALACGVLGTCGIGFAIAPEMLVRAFSEDPAVIASAAPVLYVAAIAQPLMATGVVLGEAARGAGATKVALGVSLACGAGVRLLLAYFFARVCGLGLVGIWLGSTGDWLVRALLYGAFVRSGGLRRATL